MERQHLCILKFSNNGFLNNKQRFTQKVLTSFYDIPFLDPSCANCHNLKTINDIKKKF